MNLRAWRIARYYAWLDRFAPLRTHRAETGSQTQSLHRALRDPAGGAPGPTIIHRLMLESVALPADPRVLDAGCGYGATAFDLQPKIGLLGRNLREQADLGGRTLELLQLRGAVRYRLMVARKPPQTRGNPPDVAASSS